MNEEDVELCPFAKHERNANREGSTSSSLLRNERSVSGEGVEPFLLLGNERNMNGEGVEPSSSLGNERNANKKGVESLLIHISIISMYNEEDSTPSWFAFPVISTQ